MSSNLAASRLLMVGAHHPDLPDSVHEGVGAGLERCLRDGSSGGVGADEGVLLRTCARSEIYLVTADPARTFRHICRTLDERVSSTRPLESHLRFATSAAAARHLFRTASGLESAVLGEAEVLGQVSDALATARAAGTAGTLLNRLFQDAVEVGRRVRAETEIGRGTTSLAAAAVDWAEAQLEGAGGPTALVIGAGRTGRTLALRLDAGPWGSVLVANRSVDRARQLADEVDAEPHGLDSLDSLVARADAVFVAVSAEEPVVTAGALARARPAPTVSRRIVVDLSHPRGVERGSPSEAVHLDLAQIQERVRRNRVARELWVPEAEAIVDAASHTWASWARGRRTVPVLIRFREHVLEQALAEAERAGRGRDPEERERFRRLARSVARTLLHRPSTVLRTADPDVPTDASVLEALERLFFSSPSVDQAIGESNPPSEVNPS